MIPKIKKLIIQGEIEKNGMFSFRHRLWGDMIEMFKMIHDICMMSMEEQENIVCLKIRRLINSNPDYIFSLGDLLLEPPPRCSS